MAWHVCTILYGQPELILNLRESVAYFKRQMSERTWNPIWSSSSFLPRLFRKPTTKNFLPPRLPFLIPPGLLGAIFVGTAIRKQSVLRQYSKTFGFFASQGPMLLSRTGLKNFADKTEYHRYISLYATITVLK